MNALTDAILSLGSGVLDVLDMPGSYLRGALAGRLGDRLSGREMLDEWGVTGENDPDKWFEAGDIAGFGAGLIDPINLLGGVGIARKLASRLPTYKASGQLDDILSKASFYTSGDGIADKLTTPLRRRIEKHIPPGSEYLDEGFESLVVKTPQGDILKISQPRQVASEGLDYIPDVPRIPEVLQPTHSKVFDDFVVRRFPQADIPDSGLREIAESLESAVSKRGYRPVDVDMANVGLHKGRPIILDEGSVFFPEGVKPPRVPESEVSPLIAAILGYNAANMMGGH